MHEPIWSRYEASQYTDTHKTGSIFSPGKVNSTKSIQDILSQRRFND